MPGLDTAFGLNATVPPSLGPEGGGKTPADVTEQLCGLLGPEVRAHYPNARCGTSKRGPKLWFGQPLNAQDPTVDLVIALTRRDGPGLWIPNLKKNTWEASDPEGHTDLLNGGGEALRRTRRRVIRLAKAWNKQYDEPGLSSFNIEALALASVQPRMGLATAFQAWFADAATSLATGYNTPDPAGVSPTLKLLKPRDTVVRRLRLAASALEEALGHDDDLAVVQAALARIFWDYIEEPSGSELIGAVSALRSGRPVTTARLGLAGPAVPIKPTRSYGAGGR